MHAPSSPLPGSTRCRQTRQAGSTLVIAVFVIALLVTFIGLALDFTTNTATISRRARDLTNAQALANGALEVAFKRWQTYMSANQARTIASYTKTTSFDAITPALVTQINTAAANSGFKITSLTIRSVDRSDTLPTGVDGNQTDTSASTGPMPNVPGWIAKTWTYRARATVAKVLDATAGTTDPSFSFTVARFFQQADASLFQAMLFFQDDLELHPGANMTLYGLVHTNSNLFAATSVSLTFNSNVSYHGTRDASGNIVADPATIHPNNAYVSGDGYFEGVTQTLYTQESGNWGSYNNPIYNNGGRGTQLSQVQSLDPLGTATNLAVVAGNNNATGTHEIIERPVPYGGSNKGNPTADPAIADPDAFAAHRLFNSAGLRIIINRNDNTQKVHVYKPASSNAAASTEITPTGSAIPANQNIADQIIAALSVDTTSNGSMTDLREVTTVHVNTVDVSKLTPALNNYAEYNGVVYITDASSADSSGNTADADTIRLKKGGVLPDAGMTVVSDGAIYVQGDYNTGTTYGPDIAGKPPVILTQPVSNTGADPTQFTVTGYTQKPAAVMGDAVMILSNAWVDSNSNQSIGTRTPLPTTMNAAIVSGQVLTNGPDSPSKASGGAHNFPRFLENWSGLAFTYHGSMCELYASKHFNAPYGTGGVYSAPSRRWFFDDNYLSTPPPGNLRSTTYSRGRWVRESKG